MVNLKLFLVIAFVITGLRQGFPQSEETGLASFYNDKFEGRLTSSGAVYNKNKMTAAHRTLSFNTRIRVTNLANGRTVIVTVNDRGPFVKGRIVDLSKAAAVKLDFIDQGITKVKLEVVEKN